MLRDIFDDVTSGAYVTDEEKKEYVDNRIHEIRRDTADWII